MATKANNRLIHHCFGVVWIGLRTTPAIFWLTVRVLYPGPMIWSGPGSITFGSSSSVVSKRLGIADLRIGVAQTAQVSGSWPHVQIFQQAVVPSLRLELRHAALGIVDISENDGLGGTSLRAGRGDFAIGDAAVLLLGLDFHRIDALDAVRTLFHHAAAAHRDVGIASSVQAGGAPIGIEQEVETPHFVGAVIGTIARAHAAVVNHLIDAFAAMHGCCHRTHQFARRILALHARHRLVIQLGVVPIAFKIAVHAQPVHVAPAGDLDLADHRYVVFRHASHHAGTATDT